ncbi:hypothetical protein [Caballeronia sp.]|uniref:hypothetical protein n=1 Tax=Caballeronia sp. TaxID=1931223 RepID=UPI003C3BC8A5
MRITCVRVTQAEHAELTGGVTLKSLQATAEAMGCHFVQAHYNEGELDQLEQASIESRPHWRGRQRTDVLTDDFAIPLHKHLFVLNQ